jgi:hypothetical protein
VDKRVGGMMRGKYDGEIVKLGEVLIWAMVSIIVFPHVGHTIWSACEVGGAEKEVIWEAVWLTTVDWCDVDTVRSSSDFPSALIPSAMGKTPPPSVVPTVPFFVNNVGLSFPEYEKLGELALD